MELLRFLILNYDKAKLRALSQCALICEKKLTIWLNILAKTNQLKKLITSNQGALWFQQMITFILE